MAEQEKSFRDLLKDERVKRLKRQLKLDKIKRPNSAQLLYSPQMSICDISSIRGDGPLSDFSFSTPSIISSRAGSDVVASSINLRKQLSKHLIIGQRTRPATSSVFDQSFESPNVDKDREMMPPPPAMDDHRPRSSVHGEQPTAQTDNSIAKHSIPKNYDLGLQEIHPPPSPRSEIGSAVDNERSKEISRNNESTRQNGRIFRNWTIKLNDHGQIVIRGKLESMQQARSKAVRRRLSATTVLSIHNHKYQLVGDIYDIREELPEYVRGKFYNGFPTDWENVRQLWKCFVASGCSLQFRWPRPMADSDDDLRSDITDLAVSNFKNRRPNSSTSLSTPRPSQPARETERTVRENRNRSHHQASKESDISSVHSALSEQSDIRDEEPAISTSFRNIKQKSAFDLSYRNTMEKTNSVPMIETSCKNSSEKISAVANDHSVENKTEPAGENERPECSIFPKRKIDMIAKNMIDNNCSMEYIDKFIKAVNCFNMAINYFNELLSVPLTNSVETSPDEGVSLTYKSNVQNNTTNTECRRENGEKELSGIVNSSKLQEPREISAHIPGPNSPESFEESIAESPTRYDDTYTYERRATCSRIRNAHTSSQSLHSGSSALEQNRGEIGSAQARLTQKIDVRYTKNKENHAAIPSSREEVFEKAKETNRRKRKTIFDSHDSDSEAAPSLSRGRNVSVKISSTCSISSGSKQQQLRESGRINHRIADGVNCDSDVSIVDNITAHGTKPRMLSIEMTAKDQSDYNHGRETPRSDFSFKNHESIEQDRSNAQIPKKSRDPNGDKNLGSKSTQLVEQCSVKLNKVTTEKHNVSKNNSTPAKVEKSTPRHPRDTDRDVNVLPENNPENLSMRMSSRGRRILRPLDYWHGERVVLKGQELIYSPGTRHAASSSGNSSILKNTSKSLNSTAAGDSASIQEHAKSSNKTIRDSTEPSKPAAKITNKNTPRGGILSEISDNHNDSGNRAKTSEKRRTRKTTRNTERNARGNRKMRSSYRDSDDTSDDNESAAPSKKKQRIY